MIVLRTILLLALSAALLSTVPAPTQDAATLKKDLVSLRDDADPELIVKLADLRSREAMEALVEVYDVMGSIYMKREVVRALAIFDGVTDAEQPALQKITDVATSARERELREAAVLALSECRSLGKHFLRAIIDSPAQDDIREMAMDGHIGLHERGDLAWYRELYEKTQTTADENAEREKKSKGKKKRGKKDEEEPPKERKQYHLQSIREKAFATLAPTLEEDEVIDAASEDRNPRIRRLAMEALQDRGSKHIEKVARKCFEYIEDDPANRAIAAEILAAIDGPRIADEFIELAGKFITPDYLRLRMAQILSEMGDEGVDKKVGRLVGKGKEYEKRFALVAARLVEGKSVASKIRKSLKDKDPAVQLAALESITARKDVDAEKDLRTLLKKSKDDQISTATVVALSTILGEDSEWREELVEFLDAEEATLRNAALKEVVRLEVDGHFDLALARLTHDDWSTRLTAVHALTDLRQAAAIGPIIDRMTEEHGRMLHEFAEALWVLTGQPFRTAQRAWKGWWEQNEAGFEVISDEELEKRVAEEEARRLKQISNVAFFGIRIISHRVIFIIDVSGSMAWDARAEYVGENPEPRIDIAKRELNKCIEALDPEALFNIITFSSDVTNWLDDGMSGSSEEGREAAMEYVSRLGAFGATNLYDSIEVAFQDPDVDTIFILSDGEPTSGAVTDPFLIREHVRKWNEHRGITMNCIAVGGSLQILEWLAEDSGGSYVKFQ